MGILILKCLLRRGRAIVNSGDGFVPSLAIAAAAALLDTHWVAKLFFLPPAKKFLPSHSLSDVEALTALTPAESVHECSKVAGAMAEALRRFPSIRPEQKVQLGSILQRTLPQGLLAVSSLEDSLIDVCRLFWGLTRMKECLGLKSSYLPIHILHPLHQQGFTLLEKETSNLDWLLSAAYFGGASIDFAGVFHKAQLKPPPTLLHREELLKRLSTALEGNATDPILKLMETHAFACHFLSSVGHSATLSKALRHSIHRITHRLEAERTTVPFELYARWHESCGEALRGCLRCGDEVTHRLKVKVSPSWTSIDVCAALLRMAPAIQESARWSFLSYRFSSMLHERLIDSETLKECCTTFLSILHPPPIVDGDDKGIQWLLWQIVSLKWGTICISPVCELLCRIGEYGKVAHEPFTKRLVALAEAAETLEDVVLSLRAAQRIVQVVPRDKTEQRILEKLEHRVPLLNAPEKYIKEVSERLTKHKLKPLAVAVTKAKHIED